MRHDLTTTPTALTGVEADTRYTVQNQSRHTVFIEIASTAPTDPSGAFKMIPGTASAQGIFRAGSGDSVYVWIASARLGAGAVVYDEAA